MMWQDLILHEKQYKSCTLSVGKISLVILRILSVYLGYSVQCREMHVSLCWTLWLQLNMLFSGWATNLYGSCFHVLIPLSHAMGAVILKNISKVCIFYVSSMLSLSLHCRGANRIKEKGSQVRLIPGFVEFRICLHDIEKCIFPKNTCKDSDITAKATERKAFQVSVWMYLCVMLGINTFTYLFILTVIKNCFLSIKGACFLLYINTIFQSQTTPLKQKPPW